MKAQFSFLIIISLWACKNVNQSTQVEFNQELVNELERMAEIDQIAAGLPPDSYENIQDPKWLAFKDSVFRTHQVRLEEIFDIYGYPGFDRVGEDGSMNFWLMTQHSDHDPAFQQKVLDEMKVEVDKKNAHASNYGLLVDRVNLNTGQPQVYGTQVTYNMEIGQAYPKPLADSINVNTRRKEVGLEPLEVYLNNMTKMHFEMNKAFYAEKGLDQPTLYPVD